MTLTKMGSGTRGCGVRSVIGRGSERPVVAVEIICMLKEMEETVKEQGATADEQQWMKTELYFGLRRATSDTRANKRHGVFDEEEWEAFVNDVVLPEFPSGFTVTESIGMWLPQAREQLQGDTNKPVPQENKRARRAIKLVTKILVIIHPQKDEGKVEGVRQEFLKITGQQSVLKVSYPVSVSF